jgi:hypothetical protein
MAKPMSLDIPLRGTRDYLWSGDILAALDRLAKTDAPQGYLRGVVIRKLLHREAEVHFSPHADASARFQLCNGHVSRNGWLIESAQLLKRRIAFDETPIRRATSVFPGHVRLPHPVAGYCIFEQLIVLGKELCAQIHPGNWFFTAFEAVQPVREEAALELILLQKILGRCTILELRQSGKAIGRLQSVLKQGTFQ